MSQKGNPGYIERTYNAAYNFAQPKITDYTKRAKKATNQALHYAKEKALEVEILHSDSSLMQMILNGENDDKIEEMIQKIITLRDKLYNLKKKYPGGIHELEKKMNRHTVKRQVKQLVRLKNCMTRKPNSTPSPSSKATPSAPPKLSPTSVQAAKNILGIFGATPTEAELKKIYYKRAKETHPDHNIGKPDAEFIEVNNAYNVLKKK